jgi:hypothetical protein
MKVGPWIRSVLALLLIAPTFGANYCVRQGATGAQTGADWVNAYTNLPATLVRGSTYYVADGTNYKLNIHSRADSNTNMITIRKATEADHGTSTGWNPAYGDGTADWLPVVLAASYVTFDGATGGGAGNFKTGHGFRIIDNSDTILFMLSDKYGAPNDRVSITNITVAHTEMSSLNIPGNCEGVNLTASGASFYSVTLSNLYLHDIGDGPLCIQHSRDVTIDGCWLGRNATSPDHHGVVVRMDFSNFITFRNSWFEDGVGTGFVGAYDGTGSDIYIYGNVFCYSAAGPAAAAGSAGYGNGVIYTLMNDTVGINPVNWRIYHNTFYNLPAGNCIGLYVAGSNNVGYNNLFYRVNGGSGSWSFTNVSRKGDAFGQPNSFPSETAGIALTQDPFVNAASFNLMPKDASLTSPPLPPEWGPQKDAFGNSRGAGGIWTPGAYQFPPLAGVSSPLTLVSP